jgi:nucleoside-diphosphate-sugar epimerase
MANNSPYANLPVLLLGASGFIGRSVAQALSRAGAALTLVARDAARTKAALEPLEIKGPVVECDLGGSGDLGALVLETRPAVVFNLAGYGVDPTERAEATARALNAELVRRLADAMLSRDLPAWRGQRIVHAGSALEYGAAGADLPEDGPALPTSVYGRTKLSGTLTLEAAGRTHGLRAVTARLFTVYGPGEHAPRLLPTLLAARGSSEPIPLTDGMQQRDFTFVEDAADGLLRLGIAPVPPGAIVNLATGRLTSVRTFAETAADVLGLPRHRLRFGSLPTRPEEMRHGPVTLAKLRGLTGWAPAVGIPEGVLRTKQAEDTGAAVHHVALDGRR